MFLKLGIRGVQNDYKNIKYDGPYVSSPFGVPDNPRDCFHIFQESCFAV